MADIHILDGRGRDVRVVMHFDVPDQTNEVNNSYRAALIGSGRGGTTIMAEGVGIGQVTAEEKSKIEAGEVYEFVEAWDIESGGTTNAQLRAAIRKIYGLRETEIIDRLTRQLKYFGHTESRA